MEPQNVPFVVFEMTQARHDRVVKRLIIALVVSIALIFVSNAVWLWAWTRYDYSSENVSYEQDGRGLNNLLINSSRGDVMNEPESDLQAQD